MKPHGRMRRLVEHLARVAGDQTAAGITEGLTIPEVGSSMAVRSAWVKTVIERMDMRLTQEQCTEIMEARRCRPPKLLMMKDRELWQQCGDLNEFADRKKPSWGGDGLWADRNMLRLRISKGCCHCKLEGNANSPIGKTHCRCCAGHIRAFFEPVFDMKIKVDPVTTVISGDPECWFHAYIGGRDNLDGPPVRPRQQVTPSRPAPLKSKIVPFPQSLDLPAVQIDALRAVHAALEAIASASTARTPADQLSIKAARPRMLAALWNCARGGEMRDGKLYTETRYTRDKGHLMPEPHGSNELNRHRIPCIQVKVNKTSNTYPRRWEVVIGMEADQGALMLQEYARRLCAVHGEPEFVGSNRFRGEAFALFTRADMSVFSQGEAG